MKSAASYCGCHVHTSRHLIMTLLGFPPWWNPCSLPAVTAPHRTLTFCSTSKPCISSYARWHAAMPCLRTIPYVCVVRKACLLRCHNLTTHPCDLEAQPPVHHARGTTVAQTSARPGVSRLSAGVKLARLVTRQKINYCSARRQTHNETYTTRPARTPFACSRRPVPSRRRSVGNADATSRWCTLMAEVTCAQSCHALAELRTARLIAA